MALFPKRSKTIYTRVKTQKHTGHRDILHIRPLSSYLQHHKQGTEIQKHTNINTIRRTFQQHMHGTKGGTLTVCSSQCGGAARRWDTQNTGPWHRAPPPACGVAASTDTLTLPECRVTERAAAPSSCLRPASQLSPPGSPLLVLPTALPPHAALHPPLRNSKHYPAFSCANITFVPFLPCPYFFTSLPMDAPSFS